MTMIDIERGHLDDIALAALCARGTSDRADALLEAARAEFARLGMR